MTLRFSLSSWPPMTISGPGRPAAGRSVMTHRLVQLVLVQPGRSLGPLAGGAAHGEVGAVMGAAETSAGVEHDDPRLAADPVHGFERLLRSAGATFAAAQ